MTDRRPDTPELAAGVDMLRQIYWREYGRGWREAVSKVKEVLERDVPAEAPDGETTLPSKEEK